jgi:two-component system, OmpR family, sensor histidine kinase MtrB
MQFFPSSNRLRQRQGLQGVMRRSRLVREVRRRLPKRVKKLLRSALRTERTFAAQASSRWRRSLQLRVIGTTVAISAAVIVILGFFLSESIMAGLLASAENSASAQAKVALSHAEEQSSVNTPPKTDQDASTAMNQVGQALLNSGSAGSGAGSDFYIVVAHATRLPFPQSYRWGWSNVDPSSVPGALISSVSSEQAQALNGRQVTLHYAPAMLRFGGVSANRSAVAVGAPLGAYYQLYLFFPMDQQQATLQLVQRTLIGAGVALAALLAAIASLVTRWVVLPVRHAAEAARRLSAGHLSERMPVGGADDLGALATSFNEMAANLQEKLHELEELSKVQRQFVSDVSHELRTPLSTIRMAADLLYESREQLDPASARSAELLQSQSERFEDLLTDLLEISRHDANVATLDVEVADMGDLARRSADDAQQLAERRGCRIDFRLPLEPCMAEVDRRRVERILRNLLVNAVEHGENRDVVVTVGADRDAVAVTVRDHGVGLGPGEEQLVFERFWRADPSRARTVGGTGLGLSIALEDARLHGGWLQAWGEPGRGSVFRLTLPRRAGEELVGSPLPLEPDEAGAAFDPVEQPQPASEDEVAAHG